MSFFDVNKFFFENVFSMYFWCILLLSADLLKYHVVFRQLSGGNAIQAIGQKVTENTNVFTREK